MQLLRREFEGAPLGVWLDTGAMFEIEALRLKAALAWVERFGALLRGANLRDAKTAAEGITRDLRPGDGEVDFAALKTALGDRFSRLVLAYTVPEDDPGLARESECDVQWDVRTAIEANFCIRITSWILARYARSRTDGVGQFLQPLEMQFGKSAGNAGKDL